MAVSKVFKQVVTNNYDFIVAISIQDPWNHIKNNYYELEIIA